MSNFQDRRPLAYLSYYYKHSVSPIQLVASNFIAADMSVVSDFFLLGGVSVNKLRKLCVASHTGPDEKLDNNFFFYVYRGRHIYKIETYLGLQFIRLRAARSRSIACKIFLKRSCAGGWKRLFFTLFKIGSKHISLFSRGNRRNKGTYTFAL